MKRTARDNRDLPHPRPVDRITLDTEKVGQRAILAVILLVMGVGLIGWAVNQLLAPEKGWTTISASGSSGITCGEDFTFIYDLSEGGAAENRAVTLCYTQAARRAYQLFYGGESFEDVTNLWDINHRPNEILEVDGSLYAAFGTLEAAGSRAIYLGPVYDRYGDLFLCTDDTELVDFDPRISEAVRVEYQTAAGFANDPSAIQLELLGENKLRLSVSKEYLAYAQREGIDNFIDFAWMRNAFIADYLAQELMAGGFTRGALTSWDGFVRNLDGRETDYALGLYSRQGETVYPAAELVYQGPMAIVTLRGYPINERDGERFYTLRNGEIRTPYLDPRDALCRNALPELTCYGSGLSCGELLAAMLPVYVADEVDRQALRALADRGMETVRFEDFTIYLSDESAVLDRLYDREGVRFKAEAE